MLINYVKKMINNLPKGKITRTCIVCKKSFITQSCWFKKKGFKGIYCSLKCYWKSDARKPNKGKFKEQSCNWKGGRIYERGYKMVLVNNHPYGILKGSGNLYIREHRLVMEKHLKRYLKPNEIVHHIDGDTLNNRIENLKLTTHSEHSRNHKKGWWCICKPTAERVLVGQAYKLTEKK